MMNVPIRSSACGLAGGACHPLTRKRKTARTSYIDGQWHGSYCALEPYPREPFMDPTILQTLGELFAVLGQLIVQLAALAGHWILLILLIAWALLAVNWQKAWPVMASGGWAPLPLPSGIVSPRLARLQTVPRD